MSEFNKDDYLNDLPDADNLSATGQAGPSDGAAAIFSNLNNTHPKYTTSIA